MARLANGTLVWTSVGTEMAQWLFWQKNTTGALYDAAKTMDSWTSPSELAPSPKYAITAALGSVESAAASFWSLWIPMA
ncbi:hypothetical protein D3C73_1200170 [compost metagenome]